MQTHTEVAETASTLPSVGSPTAVGVTTGHTLRPPEKRRGWAGAMFGPTATNDEQLMGAEIMSGATLLGYVERVERDPHSHRVCRLITSYGRTRRRVGVPMEWTIKRSPSRVFLGVDERSLNDLADWANP